MSRILKGRYDRQICVAAHNAVFPVLAIWVIFSAKFWTAPLNKREEKNHNGISQIPFLWQVISNDELN